MNLLRKRQAGITRAATVGIAVLLQLVVTFLAALLLQEYASWFYLVFQIFSIFLVFMLVNDGQSYKFFWVIIVLLLPVFGFFLYFMWGRKRTNSKEYRRFREVTQKGRKNKHQDKDIIREFREMHPNKAQISQLLVNYGFPLYKNTGVTYYDVGEKKFEALFKDLQAAKKFIFLEYFIISDGEIWSRMKTILTEKIQEGVEVRLLFDDFGSLMINTEEFRHELAVMGVRFGIFSPIHEGTSRLTFNYRNHQKIAIVDGNIGYTGGINIGDEYANINKRFGQW